MQTIKVRRDGEQYCFHCNARVTADARQCPGCGREFRDPTAERPAPQEKTLAERMKLQAGWRRTGRGYWRAVVVFGLLGVVLLVVRPSRRQGPVLAQPSGLRPEYGLLETREMPVRGLDRLTVILQVGPGRSEPELASVLDWALFEALDRYNGQMRKNVRVVWLYALEDTSQPVSRWRAMAIWTDPKLPESARPAGIGGDSRKAGAVEYDFTNPTDLTARGRGQEAN
jgi:RNA polymerase subunit RPABC4/transcription elongation factor Spt4